MPPFAKDQVAVGPGDLQSKLRLADLQKKQVRVTVPSDSGKAPPKFFKLLVK